MQVLCTNHDEVPGLNGWPWRECDPQIGEEYTVEKECMGADRNGKTLPCYKISGFNESVYARTCFSPLDGPDEVQMMDERCAEADAEMRYIVSQFETK